MDSGRRREPDRLSDYLVGGVTERALSPPIPARHDPIQRLADDRIFRGLHNGGHSDTVFLCALALCQIEYECKALVASFFEQSGAHKHRNATAVFPKILLLEGLNYPG